MIDKTKLALPVCLFGVYIIWVTGSTGSVVPNLTDSCFHCLCYLPTKCDMSHKCTGGYCGPFNISRVYWADAGKVVLPGDDPERSHAWERCAEDYECAKLIIYKYLEKYGRDCNGDGVTDCFDHVLVNGNGGPSCTEPLNQTANGRRWLQRYEECRLKL